MQNEIFWKRLAMAKCKNYLHLQEYSRLPGFQWKTFAIESRLTEIIEKTQITMWDVDKMEQLAKTV